MERGQCYKLEVWHTFHVHGCTAEFKKIEKKGLKAMELQQA